MNPSNSIPEEVFERTKPSARAPQTSRRVAISFAQGLPFAIDGRCMPLVDIVRLLNVLGGEFGVGRFNGLESTALALGGIKNHEVREAPAAHTILAAHQQLEQAVLNTDELRGKAMPDWEWARAVVHGGWFQPLKVALDAFADNFMHLVCGEIEVTFSPGSLFISRIASAKSPHYWNLRSRYEPLLSRVDMAALSSMVDLAESLRCPRDSNAVNAAAAN